MDRDLVSHDAIMQRIDGLIAAGDGPFSVAIGDIDNFAQINKACGNEIADEVIKKLESIFKQNTDELDMISRNGDEFLILLGQKGAERAFMEMEEIRRYLSDNTFELQDKDNREDVYITVSFGIASYPRDAKNGINLLRVADSAMFRAKKLGKNKVCLSEVESMVLKSSYFTKTQLDRLSALAKEKEKTEAFLLREALDDLFKKYTR